jgi:hypothetical protein
MADEALLQKTHAARDKYINSLGHVTPDVFAAAVNPTLLGGPMWPDLRQAWRVIRRGAHTLIMSDGLSDPFYDDSAPTVGFGVEVLVESGDSLPEPLQASWLFSLVYDMAQQCADHGGFRELIDRHGLLSFELPTTEALGLAATPDGTVGVLLGVDPPDFPTEFELPAGSVKVVTAKLLWPSELEYAVSLGRAGREELAKRFAADGTYHRSSLARSPAI